MSVRNSYCNSGPGASASNGNGVSCPVSRIITGEKLNPVHQLDMA